MYLDARRFRRWHGFLCFWAYWIGIAFWFPSAAMFYERRAYALGPGYAMADNRLYLMAASLEPSGSRWARTLSG
jgi:hypothetical protein